MSDETAKQPTPEAGGAPESAPGAASAASIWTIHPSAEPVAPRAMSLELAPPQGSDVVRPAEHRGSIAPEQTGPIDTNTTVGAHIQWEPSTSPTSASRRMPRTAPVALALGIVALAASMFVGWTFLLGIAAVIAAIVALRRPWEAHGVAIWALMLGLLSVIFSCGWLVWAAFELHLFEWA